MQNIFLRVALCTTAVVHLATNADYCCAHHHPAIDSSDCVYSVKILFLFLKGLVHVVASVIRFSHTACLNLYLYSI